MPSKYGFGNTRKKSPAMKYGAGKNPIKMLGDLDKDGEMSGYETARQTAIEKNTKKSAAPRLTKRMGKIDPNSEGNTDTKEGRSKSSMAQKRVAKAEAPFMKYGKSMAKKYKSDAQRKAVHASKAEKK
tara:strand:- start:786 stop:1169 length:384 start_codon:yes stop_codon:yes gene_type:complete